MGYRSKVAMLDPRVTHDRAVETLESKVRGFQSLTLEQGTAVSCELTALIIKNNPRIVDVNRARPIPGRVLVLTLPGR